MHRIVATLAALVALTPVCSLHAGMFHAQGEMSGEPTATSILLQSRLTAVPEITDGDVPGADGVARFEVAASEDFSGDVRTTGWLQARAETDHIVRTRVGDLLPGTRYYYRLRFGQDEESTTTGPVRSFATLPGAELDRGIRIAVGNCMNYAFFHFGKDEKRSGLQPGPETREGYPVFSALLEAAPDLFVGAGDNVYYDHPNASRARSREELRRKWREQFVQPRLVRFFAVTPGYWMKDDHDYRINDSDPAWDGQPSHTLGIRTFLEQMPIADPADARPLTYRHHRVTRRLEVWFVEGRDFRDPNNTPDGPDKSLWGAEQLEWLKRSLAASDADYKILMSPTPMVGPDDAYKKDNHANTGGFRHEGREFFKWLGEQAGLGPDRFFIVCGDRHWKYHSVHPSGYSEFSCGALNRENARLGRAPGNPGSDDPGAEVRQPYTDSPPSGGYLMITLEDGPAGALHFDLHDESGALLYRHSP